VQREAVQEIEAQIRRSDHVDVAHARSDGRTRPEVDPSQGGVPERAESLPVSDLSPRKAEAVQIGVGQKRIDESARQIPYCGLGQLPPPAAQLTPSALSMRGLWSESQFTHGI